MIVVGLTGGIGMGKSTVAAMLRRMKIPVYSADEAVHSVLKNGGEAFDAVSKTFPEARVGARICRRRLGQAVFSDKAKLKKLEKIIHPLLLKHESDFLKKAKRNKAALAVLEIPLLFEIKAEKRCDAVICVTAPKKVQRARVLLRKNMTPKKFEAIVARQMSDAEKLAKADYIIRTGGDLSSTKQSLLKVLRDLSTMP